MRTKANGKIYTYLLGHVQSLRHREQGLTLVEAVVSILIFFIAIGGIVPISLNYSLAAIRNEQKTGAIAISQQIMDELRQVDASTLPDGNTTETTLPTGTSGASLADVSFMGKSYSSQITYCQTSSASYCDANSRHIKIEVFRDGQSIYEVETVYTKFE
ncbi:prepilin-type N-terminal cleavage/methylation domain-containing protein [Acaryochloris sp. CCMEE 5410]|uniref:type IV pilus modification PilV family protein n=1 Tax=Acaryochloris sp. CCMEE 5410 TaxID=310037 RepID=UPI0002484E07|nr:type II secretion system protein [Acaryochloris sp. CCMEE 5410]KAI9135009.1 type II secretion system protein [Acaryochloris sp. CCMEE 5410]